MRLLKTASEMRLLRYDEEPVLPVRGRLRAPSLEVFERTIRGSVSLEEPNSLRRKAAFRCPCSTPERRGVIAQVASRPAAAQHLRDLARTRRVRGRIDREYAQPLDVEALARGAYMSAGHFSREFRRAYGESP